MDYYFPYQINYEHFFHSQLLDLTITQPVAVYVVP